MNCKALKGWQALRGLVANVCSIIYDTYALEKLRPIYNNYLPWTRASMRPRVIEISCTAICLLKPEIVVECGGGNSTFFIRSLLKQLGHGCLITIEEKQEWADMLSKQLKRCGLDEIGEIVCAPLQKRVEDDICGEWYDGKILSLSLSSVIKKVGVVIIDGPTGLSTHSRFDLSRRYYAVPFFIPYLAPEYFVILDDTNRLGERNCLSLWEHSLGVSFKSFGISGACAYASNSKLLLD